MRKSSSITKISLLQDVMYFFKYCVRREIKNDKEFVSKREEILSMIWNMEEEIMGKEI